MFSNILIAMTGLFLNPPSEAEVDAYLKARKVAIGEPPSPMRVKGVSAERTVAEFMDVCVRPAFDSEKVLAAVENSDLAYERDHNITDSFVWQSKRGFLVVNFGSIQAQCALSIGSIQLRSGKQLLDMLRPAIEAESKQRVQVDNAEFYLQWTEPSGYVARITLAEATNQPAQAIWYIFDKTAPGVREKLDKVLPATRNSE